MAKQNFISPAEAQRINDLLIKATSEKYHAITKPSWSSVKKSASDFLFGYEKLELLRTQSNKKIINSILQDTAQKDAPAFSLKQIHDKAFYVRAEYALAFKFDEYLSAYRGQAPKVAVYVHYDGTKQQQLSSFEMPLTKLALLADEDARLKFTPAQLRAEGAKKIEDSEDEFPNEEHMREAQSAYMGTKARLMQYYFKSNKEWWHRKNGLLMWKESRKWTIARVTSFGDMKEGYVAALLTHHQSNIDAMYKHAIGQPAYYDHDLIRIFFENFIAKVTNKAAIVEEDIVTADKQYAVKSIGASLPSIDQYLKTAQMIISQSSSMDIDQINKKIEEMYPMDAERNKIIGEVKSIADLQTAEFLSDIQKTALTTIYKNK